MDNRQALTTVSEGYGQQIQDIRGRIEQARTQIAAYEEALTCMSTAKLVIDRAIAELPEQLELPIPPPNPTPEPEPEPIPDEPDWDNVIAFS